MKLIRVGEQCGGGGETDKDILRAVRSTQGWSQEGKREHKCTDLLARMQKRKQRNYGVPGGGTIPSERRRVDGGNNFDVDSAVERRVCLNMINGNLIWVLSII